MLGKLLKTLKNTRPDADWAIFGSAARSYYEHKELCRPPTVPHSDIDIVTNAMVTREGFINLMRGCFEILDIEFGEHDATPNYAIKEIRKRVVVTTVDYGVLDFVFIPRDKKIFENWHTSLYQAGSLSQCTFGWDFLADKYYFRTTPEFRGSMAGVTLKVSKYCTGTEQYWQKQRALSSKIKKLLA